MGPEFHAHPNQVLACCPGASLKKSGLWRPPSRHLDQPLSLEAGSWRQELGPAGLPRPAFLSPSPGADNQGRVDAPRFLRSLRLGARRKNTDNTSQERLRPPHCSRAGPFTATEAEGRLPTAGQGFGIPVLGPGLGPACKAWAGGSLDGPRSQTRGAGENAADFRAWDP